VSEAALEETMTLATVTVQLPTDRLPEFYTFMAGLFEPGDGQLLTDWERTDTGIAKKVYDSLTPVAREIYDLLISSADEGFTVEEIATKTKMSPPQVRGALSWPAKHAMAYGKHPIHLQDDKGKVFVTAKVAQIFENALGR
jgi:hypothetical protein